MYIESQFNLPGNEGMNWNNRGMGPGTWQIDHVIPIKYPGKDGHEPTILEVAERLHYTNCQPMWTEDNIAKGNRFIGRTGDNTQTLQPDNPTTRLADADIDELLAGLEI